jgi:enoyl-CoA hydratase
MAETHEVMVEQVGALGRIRLNRPKAINSLTLGMIQTIDETLTRFENDPAVAAVLITGEGERGLCAGGDIRAMYENRARALEYGLPFFRAEYQVNAHIAAYKKPYIAIMDGITMGGGVGISAHGSVRIVTERTRMAMPETGIGFFPDVGGTWLLSHAPGEVGTFMGLTGDAFGGPDAIYARLADHFVPSEKLPPLLEALTALPVTAMLGDVRAVVADFTQETAAPLAAHRTEIDNAFAFDHVEDIVAALRRMGGTFAQQTLTVMEQKSPTSMKVTLRLLRLARHDHSLRDSLEREYAAVHRVLLSDEFYEGVRAAVIDKDRKPRWRPTRLEDVDEALVASYFQNYPDKLFAAQT